MSPVNQTNLAGKLFKLAIRRRSFHDHPLVLVPDRMEPLPAERLFSRGNSRKILELGAGWGEFSLEWLERYPEDELVLFEIKGERIGRILKNAGRRGISNLRIIPINFNWFLEELLPAAGFDRIIINFPDPWPKKRHWKHRLIVPAFPERMKKILKPGGEINIATDYAPYARKILGIFRRHPDFLSALPRPEYRRERPAGHPLTRFEQIHLAEGRIPYYQCWRYSPEIPRSESEEPS